MHIQTQLENRIKSSELLLQWVNDHVDQIAEVLQDASEWKAQTGLIPMPTDMSLTEDPSPSCILIDNDFTAACGQVFGRDGWVRSTGQSYGYHGQIAYNWEKLVDGVKLVIQFAEIVKPFEDNTPVPAKAFPLQLTEGSAS